jgi:hypothetical protein
MVSEVEWDGNGMDGCTTPYSSNTARTVYNTQRAKRTDVCL